MSETGTGTDQLYTATTQPGQPLPVGYTWREAEAQFNQVRRSEAGNAVRVGGGWDGLKGCHLGVVGPMAVFAMEDHDTIPPRATAFTALSDKPVICERLVDGATVFVGVEQVGIGDGHFCRVAHHKLAYALSDLFGSRLDPAMPSETLGVLP